MKIEELKFFSKDNVKLYGNIYLPAEKIGKPKPAVCFCHGIPSPVRAKGDRGYAELAEKFTAEGFVSFIFNFRGVGLSEGKFNYLGWSKDLEAAIDILNERSEVDKQRLAVVGFSGGAIISVYRAAIDNRIKAVVVGACPTYDEKEAKLIVKAITMAGEAEVIKGLSRDYVEKELCKELLIVEPSKWIGKISPRPILIIHGENDELVNVKNAYKLYEKANEPKKLAIIKGGQHKLRLSSEAVEVILKWLKEVFHLS